MVVVLDSGEMVENELEEEVEDDEVVEVRHKEQEVEVVKVSLRLQEVVVVEEALDKRVRGDLLGLQGSF